MQVHPTRTSIDLAGAALVAVAAGLLMQSGPVVAWAGALLVGLALARAVTEFSVNRIRNAGFEMLWRGEARSARTSRGERLEIEAEVRNRDSRAARFVGLRAVFAPELNIDIVPAQGEVPAGGRLRVVLRVSGRRVGRFGIHGLSLEVQGNPGLYEVPLTFANPFGVEVMPRAYQAFVHQARGGVVIERRIAAVQGPLRAMASSSANCASIALATRSGVWRGKQPPSEGG